MYESAQPGDKRESKIIENNSDDLASTSGTNNNISPVSCQSPDSISSPTVLNGGTMLANGGSTSSTSVTKKRQKIESTDGGSLTSKSTKSDDIEMKSLGSSVGRGSEENRVSE